MSIIILECPRRVLPYSILVLNPNRIRSENLGTSGLEKEYIRQRISKKKRGIDIHAPSCTEWHLWSSHLWSGSSILLEPLWCGSELEHDSKWDLARSWVGLHGLVVEYSLDSSVFASYIPRRNKCPHRERVGPAKQLQNGKANWWSTWKGPNQWTQVLSGSHKGKHAVV